VAPHAVHHELARAITAEVHPPRAVPGRVGIVSAGTSDLPVAEEAAVTAQALGMKCERYHDVGVAGIHRLFAQRERLVESNVLIVVAGMEGALPSVVGGLTGGPVIAVPTSVGYGASFGGLAALLGMLNSCAPGLLVTNIDNGFGAAYAAFQMLRMAARLNASSGDGRASS
jgi:NCAIR mutase (PurE)-related protein